MNYTTVSISDMRTQLPDLAERVDRLGEVFAIEKWGKIKAYLVPSLAQTKIVTKEEALLEKRKKILDETFGMYKNRKDWKGRSTVDIVQEMRDAEESKYVNVSG